MVNHELLLLSLLNSTEGMSCKYSEDKTTYYNYNREKMNHAQRMGHLIRTSFERKKATQKCEAEKKKKEWRKTNTN